MGLTRVAINRPLFILMVISAMVIMGAIAYTRLGRPDLGLVAMTEVADHVIVVSSEGGSWFPSMTAGVCAVNAVLTSLEQQGGQKVQDAIADMEHTWAELELYDI
ncbi:MAG: hypothetical protein K6V36_16815 [Anaerolineae bacterium]|nr:hypothetical protein [Anaerolineae bacterium]